MQDLGRRDYRSTYDLQLELVAARQSGEVNDTLLVVEHPHVITLGRTRSAPANVLAAGDVPVEQIERGGDVTYHGPGQLVVYPIVYLRRGEQDLHAFLRHLEQAMIDSLAALGVPAGRVPGKTGVWVGETPGAQRDQPESPEQPYRRKIASIGIACRKWVTFHGLALNVSTELSYFRRINPCGFEAGIMTSIERELGRPVELGEVSALLLPRLATALGRELVEPEG